MRKRNKVDSALDDFSPGFAFVKADSPWQTRPSGGCRRTSEYACGVHSGACRGSAQAVTAALRDMARTASMDVVSAKLGGEGVCGAETMCKGAAGPETQ